MSTKKRSVKLSNIIFTAVAAIFIVVLSLFIYKISEHQETENAVHEITKITDEAKESQELVAFSQKILDDGAEVINDNYPVEKALEDLSNKSFHTPDSIKNSLYISENGEDGKRELAEFSFVALSSNLKNVTSRPFKLLDNTSVVIDKKLSRARVYLDESAGAPVPFTIPFVKMDNTWLLDGDDMINQVRITNIMTTILNEKNKEQ